MSETSVSGVVTWRETKVVNTPKGEATLVEVKLETEDGTRYRGSVWSDTLRPGAERLSKGDTATLKGKLSTKDPYKWTDKDGKERVQYDLTVYSIMGFGESKSNEKVTVSPAGTGKVHVLVTKDGVEYAGIINSTVKTSSKRSKTESDKVSAQVITAVEEDLMF